MQQIDQLSKALNPTFNWNKARTDCFVGILIALLKLRSINLTELASAFPSEARKESRYRRIQRFICEHFPDFDVVALFIMQLFGFLETGYTLTLDRTNWKWGRKKHQHPDAGGGLQGGGDSGLLAVVGQERQRQHP